MRNIGLEIEYDGTNYCGWQVQKCRKSQVSSLRSGSIQGTIEKTLQRILQEKIKLIGSGRTDAGVHAKAQAANFKTKRNIALDKLQKALNGLLPDDIVITRIEEVPLDFHSRFDAKSKMYRYTILNHGSPSALLRDTIYFCPRALNIRLMQKEARILLGKHNFKSFQASDTLERDSVRTIKSIKITRDKDFIYIDLEADGFLHNMVRNIVGTLIEIGADKPIDMKRLLSLKDRTRAGPTAPAKGLCLMKVSY
jgi:tRNA pseudouridine38-40 synthase